MNENVYYNDDWEENDPFDDGEIIDFIATPSPEAIQQAATAVIAAPAPPPAISGNYIPVPSQSGMDIDFTFNCFNEKPGVGYTRKPRKIADCCECNKPIMDDGNTSFHRYGLRDKNGERSMLFCSPCKSHFTECSVCGSNFREADLKLKHCSDCLSQVPSRLIQQYSTKAEQKLKMLGKPFDQLFSGVELELESKDYGFDTLRVHGLVKNFAILKRDSSINQGFEIVSAPCALDVHRQQWDNFFKELPSTVKAEETCGMHVHISRVRLSDLQIAKMLKFLHNPANRQFVSTIAGRGSSYHNNFDKPKNWRDGREGGRMQADADRHTALNLNNPKTIEFRIFAATLSYEVFIKNIEFCYALVKFTNWGQASLTDAISFPAFYKFVHEYRKDYPSLWKFLVNNLAFKALKNNK